MDSGVFCTYCGQRFSRGEHLERHVLTHTNVKPYKCEICHSSFNRQDLFQRHVRLVHKENSDSDSTDRARIACQSCAKAKIKCDKEIPCSRCKDKGLRCQPRTGKRAAEDAHRESKRKREQEHAAQEHEPVMSQSKTNNDPLESVQWQTTTAESRRHTSPSGCPSAIDLGARDSVVPKDSQYQPRPSKTPPTEYLIPSFGPSFLPSPFDTPIFEMGHLGFVPPPNGTNVPIGQSLANANMHQDPYHFDLAGANTLVAPLDDGDEHATAFIFGSGGYVPVNEGLRLQDATIEPSPIEAIAPTTQISTGSSNLVGLKDPEIIKHNAWPGFGCNPPFGDTTTPRMAEAYPTEPQGLLQDNEAWESETKSNRISLQRTIFTDEVVVQKFTSRARDRLLVITQNTLRIASSLNRQSLPLNAYKNQYDQPHTRFLSLPPPEVLENFLSTYALRFEPHYELISSNFLDPDVMLNTGNQEASSVLLLLMIAHGASVGGAEARHLCDVLTESCRIVFRDLTGTGTRGSDDIEIFRVALATVGLTAWSGHAWHINTALRQWALFTSWFMDSDLLSSKDFEYKSLNDCADVDTMYQMWQRLELRARIVYAWMGIDLELSVFFDTPPKLSVKDLNILVPSNETPGRAGSIDDFLAFWSKQADSPASGSSSRLFQRFLERELGETTSSLSPKQLQLLLHGIQGLATHLYECFTQFFDFGPQYYTDRLTTGFGTRALLQEVQSLLQYWFNLYQNSMKNRQDPFCTGQCTLVLYHLMHARVLFSFPELELMARAEPPQDFFSTSPRTKGRLVEEAANIHFHCGQTLRLISAMPYSSKPSWWAAAVYRVAILLWATSWTFTEAPAPSSSDTMANEVAISCLDTENEALNAYVKARQGTPVLISKDGCSMSLHRPDEVLGYMLEFIDEQNDNTRFVEGIKARLVRLRERWKAVS